MKQWDGTWRTETPINHSPPTSIIPIYSRQKWRLGDRRALARQRTAQCFPGGVPMAQAHPRKYSAGWATLLSQRFLAGQPRYLARSHCIDRDSLPQEMGVRVPTIGRSRWHHSSKLDPNIHAGCRGPLSWKGEANRCYRPGRRTKAANLVLCMGFLSQNRERV